MRDVSIERLTLQLSHWPEGDARRLARLVAEGLAGATIGGGQDGYVASLAVTLQAPPGEGVERLAERVVADVLRQMGAGHE
jgi:hypothetical protein